MKSSGSNSKIRFPCVLYHGSHSLSDHVVVQAHLATVNISQDLLVTLTISLFVISLHSVAEVFLNIVRRYGYTIGNWSQSHGLRTTDVSKELHQRAAQSCHRVLFAFLKFVNAILY